MDLLWFFPMFSQRWPIWNDFCSKFEKEPGGKTSFETSTCLSESVIICLIWARANTWTQQCWREHTTTIWGEFAFKHRTSSIHKNTCAQICCMNLYNIYNMCKATIITTDLGTVSTSYFWWSWGMIHWETHTPGGHKKHRLLGCLRVHVIDESDARAFAAVLVHQSGCLNFHFMVVKR